MTRFATLRERLQRAVEDSWVARVGTRTEATLTEWSSNSRIVGWFLTEPDPEVVVIDLRETYTVGPLLGLLSSLYTTAEAVAETSGLSAAGATLADRYRVAPIRVIGAGLLLVRLAGLVVSIGVAPDPRTTGWWLVLVGVALLATRERRSADELDGTLVGRVFMPPESGDD